MKKTVIIAVANQKGGVAKTTTVQNIGYCLASDFNKKVLVVDLDPQANLTDAWDIDEPNPDNTIYELLKQESFPTSKDDQTRLLTKFLVPLSARLDLLPACISLASAEQSLLNRIGRENLLRKALSGSTHDMILIDCPPSLGLLTVNAMAAAHYLLIPVQAEYHALAGITLVKKTCEEIRTNINSDIRIIGILATMVDKRKSLNAGVVEMLADTGEKVFKTVIRDNVALAEAPSHGLSIFQYKKRSYGAEDYSKATKELLTLIRKIEKE